MKYNFCSTRESLSANGAVQRMRRDCRSIMVSLEAIFDRMRVARALLCCRNYVGGAFREAGVVNARLILAKTGYTIDRNAAV